MKLPSKSNFSEHRVETQKQKWITQIVVQIYRQYTVWEDVNHPHSNDLPIRPELLVRGAITTVWSIRGILFLQRRAALVVYCIVFKISILTRLPYGDNVWGGMSMKHHLCSSNHTCNGGNTERTVEIWAIENWRQRRLNWLAQGEDEWLTIACMLLPSVGFKTHCRHLHTWTNKQPHLFLKLILIGG